MKNKSLIAAAMLVILFACNDDDDTPQITSLLKLTVDASFSTVDSGHWIIVHGEDGSLLAHTSFESGQELDIKTQKPVPGKITVTYLRYLPGDGITHYLATTDSNIEKGKHMILKTNSFLPNVISGKINVSINDLSTYNHFAISSRLGASASGLWSSGTKTLGLSVHAYEGVSKYIVTVSSGDMLRQRVLSNVKANSSFSFSFNEMDPFDRTVDFTFPSSPIVTLFIFGSDPAETLTPNSYFLITNIPYQTYSTVKAGYLNGLTNYTTRLVASYPDHALEYTNIGSVPDGNIAWPQRSDFDISDKSFATYTSIASKPYIWRQSRWDYSEAGGQTRINWFVSSSSESQLIKELPEEIISAHPDLSLSKLKYTSTVFYTQSPSFESSVDARYEKTGAEPDGVRLGISIMAK